MSTPGPGEGITYIAQDYENNNSNYAAVASAYKAELQGLIDAMHSGKITADHALWMFQLTCMPDATQGCEYQMAAENDALLAANAIRNQITNAQNSYNQEMNFFNKGMPSTVPSGTPKGQTKTVLSAEQAAYKSAAKSVAKKLYSALGEIENFIHSFHLTAILGASNVKAISGYVQNITNAINPNPGHPPTPGHTGQDIYSNLNKMFSGSAKNGQNLPSNFNQITSNFNNLNQSVSGVSSYIQTQMQYLNQNLQQYFSVYNNFFSDYSSLNAYIVNKSAN